MVAELDDILGSLLGDGAQSGEKGGEGDLIDILFKVMPLIETVNKETDDERLLRALMPYMSDIRKERLDTAQSILKIAKILPLVGKMLEGEDK